MFVENKMEITKRQQSIFHSNVNNNYLLLNPIHLNTLDHIHSIKGNIYITPFNIVITVKVSAVTSDENGSDLFDRLQDLQHR